MAKRKPRTNTPQVGHHTGKAVASRRSPKRPPQGKPVSAGQLGRKAPPRQALHRHEQASRHRKNELSELARRLLRKVPEQYGIKPGKRMGVAVSGGADSVALLRLLLEVREAWGVVLSGAHFNHQLRGKASEADEKFVSKLAAQYDLPFFVAREDVAGTAREKRANLEEMARRMRYVFFERLV